MPFHLVGSHLNIDRADQIFRPNAQIGPKDDRGHAARSCREAADELGVTEKTLWLWRIRIISVLLPELEDALTGMVEADEARQQESRKTTRECVRHAANSENCIKSPRKRWRDHARVEEPPGGWSRWQEKFLAATNRGGCCSFEAITNTRKKEISVPLLRALAPDAFLCAGGWPPRPTRGSRRKRLSPTSRLLMGVESMACRRAHKSIPSTRRATASGRS